MMPFPISIHNFKSIDTLQIRLHLQLSPEAAASRQDIPGTALTSPTHLTARQALWDQAGHMMTEVEPYPPGHSHSAQDMAFFFPGAFTVVAHDVRKTDGDEDWVTR